MILHKILKRQQQPSLWVKVAITREQSFSLQIYESKSKKTWLEAYRNSSHCNRWAVTAGIHTHTDTQSALPYLSCGYASRHKYCRWMTHLSSISAMLACSLRCHFSACWNSCRRRRALVWEELRRSESTSAFSTPHRLSNMSRTSSSRWKHQGG